MSIAVHAERDGDRARLVPVGAFDVAHARAVAQAVADTPANLEGCRSIDVDLTRLDRIDGAGAVLLARFLDRLDADGNRTRLVDTDNPRSRAPDRALPTEAFGASSCPSGNDESAGTDRRSRRRPSRQGVGHPRLHRSLRRSTAEDRRVTALSRLGSLPRLVQQIGADALPVTSAANLLVGVIIGFLGVSQLGRFGAVVYVPELVVVAHFRELGPLVTAIVVAGRSASRAAGHSRFTRSAARSRTTTAGAAGVGRLWPSTPGGDQMRRMTGSGSRLLVVLICLAGIACQLKRPETMPGRMIEPQLLSPQAPAPAEQRTRGLGTPAPVRLIDTQARGHIGRRLTPSTT